MRRLLDIACWLANHCPDAGRGPTIMRSDSSAFPVRRANRATLKGIAPLALITATFAAMTVNAGAGTLTPSQAVDIQSQVSKAVAAIDPALTGAARRNAIEQSLQGLAQADAALGPDGIAEFVRDSIHDGVAPMIVVSASIRGALRGGTPGSSTIAAVVRVSILSGAPAEEVAAQSIVTGMTIRLPAMEIGSGLGTAAAQLESTDAQDARTIGRVVANEGTADMGTAYASAVAANGGSQELAALGTGNPEVTGAANVQLGAGQYQGGNIGNNNNGEGNLGENLPPCASPSCT